MHDWLDTQLVPAFGSLYIYEYPASISSMRLQPCLRANVSLVATAKSGLVIHFALSFSNCNLLLPSTYLHALQGS